MAACMAAVLASSLSAQAENIRFAGFPSLSPDGSTIYFSYNGDIFNVPAAGGLATNIVTMDGRESHPVVSPDGKYLAFSSDLNGNDDVYVVPCAGGQARQLTFHEAADFPVSWSADSKEIYFESRRSGASRTTYKVSVEGGTPQLMFQGGYFTTVVNLVENPVDGSFYFNESAESINFPTRKRYVGDHNPDIQCWNPGRKEHSTLTSHPGKDTWPMVDVKGNLYYVSDEAGNESNIFRHVPGGKAVQLTSYDSSVQYPRISADGSAIVYLLDYQIHVLNPQSGKDLVPEIRVAGGDLDVTRVFKGQKPADAAVSPDGKKLAFAIRGQIYVSDAKCSYFKKLETPSDERVKEVVWGRDNRTVFYTRTAKGYSGLYRIAADGSSAEQAIHTPQSNVTSITVSPDGKMVAFIDGSSKLMLCNTADNSTRTLAEVEFWSFSNYRISFSWDNSLIAFEAMDRFEGDIYTYDLKEGKLRNLTYSASNEQEPVFSPDGKYLYFTALTTGTSFPRGSRDNLCRLPLRKYDTKFKSDEYDKLFAPEKEKKEEDAGKDDAKTGKGVKKAKSAKDGKEVKETKEVKDTTVRIDYEDIFDRLEIIERKGGQGGLLTFKSGEKSWLFYNSSTDSGREAYSLDITDPEAKPKLIKGLAPGWFFASDKEIYHISGGTVSKIDPNSLSTTTVNVAVDVEKNLSDEFSQMFYEVWAMLDQNFYDVNFHGTDWKAVRDRYAAFLPYVHSRDNLRTLIADMLGELNSSHLGFSSNGAEERKVTQSHSILTGIVFDNDSPYTVDHILSGSPADKVEIDVIKGDRLVAVDGVRTDEKTNREKYLSTTLDKKETKLTFERNGKEFSVKVHTAPFSTVKSLQYRQWEDGCKAMVEKESDGRIAYIHLRAMGDEDLESFLTKMHTYAANKSALILDLRYNNGGNVHQEVIDFLRRQQHFEWSYRDFSKTTHPNVIPSSKPVVVLVNEHSLSDAEVTSNGIKTLGIAKIVGTETYRWIIFTSGTMLIDGSYCRLPAWGCYNNEGVDLESIGVKPDIYVKNTFKDRISGEDPQLKAAVDEVLRQLKSE